MTLTKNDTLAMHLIEVLEAANLSLDQQFIVINIARAEVRKRQTAGVVPMWRGPIGKPSANKKAEK